MAEKLVARSKSKVKLAPRVTTFEVDGATVNPGDMVGLAGEDGRFRFKFANKAGTEVTVWGPYLHDKAMTEGGGWNSAQWRTVKADKVLSVTQLEAVAAAAAEVAAANGETEYSLMTPGQKAAWTKRLKAQVLVAA